MLGCLLIAVPVAAFKSQLTNNATGEYLHLNASAVANCLGQVAESLYVGLDSAGRISLQGTGPTTAVTFEQLWPCLDKKTHTEAITIIQGPYQGALKREILSQSTTEFIGRTGKITATSKFGVIHQPIAEVSLFQSSGCSGSSTSQGGGDPSVCYTPGNTTYSSAQVFTGLENGYLNFTGWSDPSCGGNKHILQLFQGNEGCYNYDFTSYSILQEGTPF